MRTPILETERLLLRPFKESDGEDVFHCWESDPEVAKYMFWRSHNDISKSIAWAKKEAAGADRDDWYRFAVVEKTSGKLAGTVLIYYEEEVANWEIAYNLGRNNWGKGYATEAMKRVIEFAREKLHLDEIVGRHAKENVASERVMQKLGFSFVKDIPYICNEGVSCYEGKLYKLKIVQNQGGWNEKAERNAAACICYDDKWL